MGSYEDEVKREFIRALNARIKEHLEQLERTTLALVELHALKTEPEEFKVGFEQYLKNKKSKK